MVKRARTERAVKREVAIDGTTIYMYMNISGGADGSHPTDATRRPPDPTLVWRTSSRPEVRLGNDESSPTYVPEP